jgi:hypothetical protein
LAFVGSKLWDFAKLVCIYTERDQHLRTCRLNILIIIIIISIIISISIIIIISIIISISIALSKVAMPMICL